MNKSKLFISFFAVILFLVAATMSMSQNKSAIRDNYPDGKFPPGIQMFTAGDSCNGTGVEQHDGPVHGNGYTAFTDSVRMCILFHPTTLPWTYNNVCCAFTRTSTGPTSHLYDIVVYDTLGAGGTPGSLLQVIPGNTVSGIGIYPQYTWNSTTVTINVSASLKAVYIGYRYANSAGAAFYCTVDEQASTPLWPGYYATNTTFPAVWQTIQSVAGFTAYKCMAIRTQGQAAASNLWNVPELIYYRFHNNTATTTFNWASAPVGTNPSPYTNTTVSTGGQFDSCMLGTTTSGTTGNSGVLPGWNWNVVGSWTISMWIKNITDGNPTYLFGDPGSTSFRCFYGGAAGVNNLLLRGPMADLLIPCTMPGPQVITIVYTGTQLLIYTNGALTNTVSATFSMPTGTGFRVGGYTGGVTGINAAGLLDEFRLYSRALTAAEIAGTWNHELPVPLGVSQNGNNVPHNYNLAQNYPNPFNPTTNINFSIPKTGLVKLVVYDVLGKVVATPVNEVKTAGDYSVNFDASNFASGVYFYKIQVNDFTETKKMLLVK